MCQPCERYEKDAIKANLEDWESLAEILARNSIIRVFVNMYGSPVQVSKYDVLGAILGADHNNSCPGWIDDTPNLGDLTISGL